ncbi:protein translocase subunit SecF [Marinagarivorans cellulosilyticus]|uniref:Protein-export membrane protein SecF n=1 Tax=Marinagarivorans cellulosilyticus TaxID=2721545 RepID=A0AAN2BKY7_9GAMM|nr:protein translocase subunit SecF [Marinagarivorans cellulosilyticus]BCD98524.1 preprotein translocase subunit SecF [Marinagarivorans cellulosilyticus]
MSDRKNINFMAYGRVAAISSLLLIVVSIGSLFINGLNLGLDFTGGTSIELEYAKAPNLEDVRSQLVDAGYSSAVVVAYGADTDVMVRIQGNAENLADEVTQVLNVGDHDVIVKQASFIGPQIGEELRDDGGLGMLFALAVVMVYVALRFQFKFSVGAVAALVHDVIIVLGIFSLFQLDFDLTVLAAILAVIGYSLNDTIVVYDRIRENFRIVRDMSVVEIVNYSLTQTLGRTLMTSGTTIVVLLALFFVGGEMIHNFATALLIGVGVGTYSSIYVASAILLAMKVTQEDLMPPKVEVEGEELEELP